MVDECHRGSAAEDSAWREILAYFSSATQIGMTATPKETKYISNIHYFGKPIYSYSLKQGIQDGFLAPYKVIKVHIDRDVEGYRPEPGKVDREGKEVEDRIYNQKDFDRTLVIDDRTKLVAKKISDFLKQSGDRFQKTIVFCVDTEHAARMRQALVNENSDLCVDYPAINDSDFALLLFPLPPISEQHRIVAKVDELMALCDKLEAARAEREATRDRLAAASLACLNAPEPDTFQDDTRVALDALPALTTRPDQVPQLRQAILNLAVRGKLVPQDPRDESASELLKRITAEKVRLIKNREIRQRDTQPVTGDEAPFQLPRSWVWTRLGTLCFLITDGAHHTPQYEDQGVPFLSVKDVSGGAINFSGTKFISEEAHRELAKRCNPERGDILLTKVGTTGIAVNVNVDSMFSIFVSLALLKFSQSNADGRYLCTLINSPFVRRQSADNTQGIGNKNLVLRLISRFVVPIPPLNEQHRIVAKVDELMAICDRLEASLISGEDTRRRLLDALIHETLTPGERPEPEQTERVAAHAGHSR